MAFTTHQGPIRVGTVREGSGKNVGLVTLAQTVTVPYTVMLASPSEYNLGITLPAGAKIIDLICEVTTALATATNVGIQIGISGTAAKYWASFNSGATAVRTSPATVAAAQVTAQTKNIGTSDVTLYGTFTAATGDATDGEIQLTFVYVQRASDGSVSPNP